MKVVYDTNIFISALIFPGEKPVKAFNLILEGAIFVCSSPAILHELWRILKEKFGWDEVRLMDLLHLLGDTLIITKPRIRLKVAVHDADNRVLECALDSGAEYIVTGDRHLLDLGSYQNVKIVKLSDFLDLVEKKKRRAGENES